MKLKTLCKVLSAVKYELVVYDKKGRYITAFIVDYLACGDNDNILRKIYFEEATVSSVYSRSVDGLLTVHVKV